MALWMMVVTAILLFLVVAIGILSFLCLFGGPNKGYREIATTRTTLARLDESMVHKTERAQPPFLETIVGRRGGLRSILAEPF